MKIRTIIVGVLLWPLRAFRFMAGLTMQMFRPGGDEAQCKVMPRRYGRASRYRLSFGDGSRADRWRFIHKRIRRAGKRTRFRR